MYTHLFSYMCMYIYKYMYMFVCIHIYRYLRIRKQQYNKAESFFLDILYYFSIILPSFHLVFFLCKYAVV